MKGSVSQNGKKGVGHILRFHAITILLVSLFCVIVYSNTLHSPFVFDDLPNITNNSHIRLTNLNISRLYDAGFKSPSLRRPVANMSFALNYYIGQYDATGYHIVNIIIHLVNGILVYFLAVIIFRQLSNISEHVPASKIPESAGCPIGLMSLFAALIFITHPVQTQSVTYIVQRMNSMAVMFYLFSLLLYVHGRLAQKRWKRWALFTGCLSSGFMAFGCKEIAATLPFIILLYEWYFFQDLSITWLKRNIVYLMVPIAILLLFVFIYVGVHPLDRIAALYTKRDFTVWERVFTQFRVVIFYISLLLFPHPSRLNLIHHITISRSLLDPVTTWICLLLIVGLLGLGVYTARRQRLVSFCILWFFINLVIESSVFGLEMIYEHRLYLPMFGFSLLLIYLLFHFLSNRRSWATLISITLVLLLATAAYVRNNTWRDEITLWNDVLTKNPRSARGHLNVGAALMRQGNLNEAIAHYYEALKIKPYWVRVHNNLGLALGEIGRIDEAVSHYRMALKIRPNYMDAHVNLARTFKDIGKLDEAISHYERVLRIGPNAADSAQAHNNLAIILEEQGRLDEAISHYYAALRINPNQADVHYNLALALEDMGKPNEAIVHYNAALKIKPDHVKAHNHLALVEAVSHYEEVLKTEPNQAQAHEQLAIALAQQGKLDEAIAHFYTALELKPDNAEVHNNLGIALARKGDLDQAMAHFSEALQLDPELEMARQNMELTLEKLEALKAPPEEIETESGM